jgi:plasmid maintenance system antidote protein VapI
MIANYQRVRTALIEHSKPPLHFTQDWLANSAGIERTRLNRLLRGRTPTSEELARISDVMKAKPFCLGDISKVDHWCQV